MINSDILTEIGEEAIITVRMKHRPKMEDTNKYRARASIFSVLGASVCGDLAKIQSNNMKHEYVYAFSNHKLKEALTDLFDGEVLVSSNLITYLDRLTLFPIGYGCSSEIAFNMVNDRLTHYTDFDQFKLAEMETAAIKVLALLDPILCPTHLYEFREDLYLEAEKILNEALMTKD